MIQEKIKNREIPDLGTRGYDIKSTGSFGKKQRKEKIIGGGEKFGQSLCAYVTPPTPLLPSYL